MITLPPSLTPETTAVWWGYSWCHDTQRLFVTQSFPSNTALRNWRMSPGRASLNEGTSLPQTQSPWRSWKWNRLAPASFKACTASVMQTPSPTFFPRFARANPTTFSFSGGNFGGAGPRRAAGRTPQR